MIEVTNLVKEFDLNRKQRKQSGDGSKTARAVDNISFQCIPGKIFGLLGPNGAGKTTTLRMIATILKPTSGSIRVCGHDATTDTNELRRKIGFLTGSTGLYARLNPEEMIGYFARLYSVPDAIWKQRMNNYFDLLDMHEFRKKRLGQLSTGMKQKVSIVRTMIHDPQVVVFDEPTSGLDVITAANIIQLIKDCKEKQKTVIFSSHIMSEVDLLCDDLAIVHKGRLAFNSTMDEFRSQNQGITLTDAFIRTVQNMEATV